MNQEKPGHRSQAERIFLRIASQNGSLSLPINSTKFLLYKAALLEHLTVFILIDTEAVSKSLGLMNNHLSICLLKSSYSQQFTVKFILTVEIKKGERGK